MLLALSSVIFVVIQDGISQKLGESCIMKQTDFRGVCTESIKCQSAIRDYRIGGLIPTYCDQTDDLPVVCCRLPVLNAQEEEEDNTTPVLKTALSSDQNLDLSISDKNETCRVQYTNSRGKCTESSKCLSAKQDYEKSGILPTFCNQTDTLVLVCCRDGITILDTEQNSDDESELSKVVFSKQNTGAPLSKKEGDECIVAQTNTRGVCTQSTKCQSAIQEYQHNGIFPTFCKHSDDVQLVCCKDGITILDTEEVNDNTPLLKSSFHDADEKNVLNLKLGDSCVDKHTNSLGNCTEVSKCTSVQQEHQINGSVPTYCQPSDNVQLVCCRNDILANNIEKDEEYDDMSEFRSLLPLSQKLNKPLNQEVGDSCLVQQLIKTRGVCTEVSECQSAVREYVNRFIAPTFCNNTEKVLVCCKDGISIFSPTQKNKKELAFKNSISFERNTRISETKCKEYAQSVFQTVTFIASGTRSIFTPKCNYAGVELIVGGENANQGEFPHMAAIGWIDLNDNYAFQCGGSLISTRFVLTAGHCIKNPKMKDPKPSIVRLGDQNLDPTVADGARPVDIPIKTVYKHPDYHSPEKYNDIALFELNVDVEFEVAIRPACLWTKPDFSGHTKAVATGWGVSDIVKKKHSLELQKVTLSLLENEDCEVLLEDTHNRNWDGFIESQMCAGELLGGKDTCQGDSGSPLQIVSKENNCIFYIVGITSFGWNCAKAGRPAVYTRVYSYLDWIESIVWPDE